MREGVPLGRGAAVSPAAGRWKPPGGVPGCCGWLALTGLVAAARARVELARVGHELGRLRRGRLLRCCWRGAVLAAGLRRRLRHDLGGLALVKPGWANGRRLAGLGLREAAGLRAPLAGCCGCTAWAPGR